MGSNGYHPESIFKRKAEEEEDVSPAQKKGKVDEINLKDEWKSSRRSFPISLLKMYCHSSNL